MVQQISEHFHVSEVGVELLHSRVDNPVRAPPGSVQKERTRSHSPIAREETNVLLYAGVMKFAGIQRDDASFVAPSQDVVEECLDRPIGHHEHCPTQGMLLL